MRTKIHAILGGVCAPLLLATPALGEEVHWPLQDSIWNSSGAVPRLLNHGVVFDVPAPDGSRAARFDGVSAFLERRENWAPAFFVGDFTVSVEVFVEEPLDDAPGDILGCFDPYTRRGVNFGIASHSGVANSQPNHRNVYFGVYNGRLETDWTDCGRPGQAVFVFGFAVHDGALYAATCESHEGGAGHVYRYAGGDRWEDCGSPDGSNAVAALAVHDGAIYAGTSRYDTTGSAMAASPNTTPGGKVYRYDGGTAWTFCGELSNPETGTAATLGGLAVFQGALHATTLKQDGFGLYRYGGGETWAYCGNPGRRVLNPCVFNGALHMVSYDAPGGPFRYDGKGFSYIGGTITPPIQQDYSFAVYGGELHLSTWPEAHVYRLDRSGVWRLRGRPGDELETMGMMAYNGKLYTGTLPSARVYRLDGADRWTPVGRVLDASDNKYRRAWSMALFQGRLFCGTLPSGRVFSLEAGRCVTDDHALPTGWRCLDAVRRGGRLFLYVDGKQAAESAPFDPADYDLGVSDPFGDIPLRIGFGASDYFHGWMRNLRISPRALSAEELAAAK